MRPHRAILSLVLATALAFPTAARAAFWGHDGDIVFTSSECDSDGFHVCDEYYALQRVDPGGGEPQPLSACRESEQYCGDYAAWAPDGRSLAFQRPDGVYTAADGESSRERFRGRLAQPSWSPGGRWLVTVNSYASLVLMRRDGTHAHSLNSGYDAVRAPAWGVNGLIAFVSAARGGDRIETVRRDGTRRRVLTRGSDPDWSPSGRRIAFERNGDVFLADRNGRHERMVVPEGTDPAWSPSGDRIAFRTAEGDIATVYMDGTGFLEVARHPKRGGGSAYGDPAWQPLR